MKRHAIKKRTIVMVMAILVGVLMMTASAALLTYYGKVTTTANVSQSVLLDGNDYNNPLTYEFDVIGGCCKWSCHELENTGCVNAPIAFDTQYIPDGDGITTKYYTPTHYSFATNIDTVTEEDEDILIIVEDGECHITWTIDFPVEEYTGGGHMNVGLIIAQDGNEPSFQIHNNDGQDSRWSWGTWLYSPWGPTSNDGWNGWHSQTINIPIEDLSCQWAEATGETHITNNPDGIFTITLAKCVIGADFDWALAVTIGSGFHEASKQYYYPTGFSWSESLNMANYEAATIMIDLSAGFTLGKYQSKEIIICHCFDIAIIPGTYTIVSQFRPGP